MKNKPKPIVYVLIGEKRVGKDTVYQILKRLDSKDDRKYHRCVEVLSYGDILKSVVSTLTHINEEIFHEDELKDKPVFSELKDINGKTPRDLLKSTAHFLKMALGDNVFANHFNISLNKLTSKYAFNYKKAVLYVLDTRFSSEYHIQKEHFNDANFVYIDIRRKTDYPRDTIEGDVQVNILRDCLKFDCKVYKDNILYFEVDNNGSFQELEAKICDIYQAVQIHNYDERENA